MKSQISPVDVNSAQEEVNRIILYNSKNSAFFSNNIAHCFGFAQQILGWWAREALCRNYANNLTRSRIPLLIFDISLCSLDLYYKDLESTTSNKNREDIIWIVVRF